MRAALRVRRPLHRARQRRRQRHASTTARPRRRWAWRAHSRIGEVFASLGRGFETPTVTELAYRPDGGAGFNIDLQPAHFDTAEVGARWRFAIERRRACRCIASTARTRSCRRQPRRPRQFRQRGQHAARRRRGWHRGALPPAVVVRTDRQLVARALHRAVQLSRAQRWRRAGAGGGGRQSHSRHSARRRLRRTGLERRTTAASSPRWRCAPATASPPTTATPTPAPGYAHFALRLQWRAAASGWCGVRARGQPVRSRLRGLGDRQRGQRAVLRAGGGKGGDGGVGVGRLSTGIRAKAGMTWIKGEVAGFPPARE